MAKVRSKGMGLLEVLLGIVIFVVGLLALLHLQTNLTRSSSDASARTVAMNIGEEFIERLRSFERVGTDPLGFDFAFTDIVDGHGFVSTADPISRGGLEYEVTGTVWAYDYNEDGTDVTAAVPAVAGELYDFKRVDLTIVWNEDLGFKVDDTTTITPGGMNTGQVTIEGVISSIPPFSSARLAADVDLDGDIPVKYTPGLNPDIIRLGLGGDRFKESTTPMPEIKKSEGSTETWFDVITYNQTTGAPEGVFLRREEFLVVSCECKLRNPSGDGEGGFLPTIWNGKEYVTGPTSDGSEYVERDVFIDKLYGESTSTTPGVDYCVTCCRDHHDDSGYDSVDEVYDPARAEGRTPVWTEEEVSSGDHTHYSRSKKGELTPVAINGTYVEACRMVRKDGFMRVAQDFRQEGLVGFPEGYLDTADGASSYSSYAINAVSDFYVNDRDTLTGPDGELTPPGASPWSPDVYPFPGTETNPTSLPFPGVGGLNTQQMRSRAIYIDHLGAEAQATVDCLYAHDGEATISDTCETPGVNSFLEALPFFEVQTTWLSWWNENPAGIPVAVSNEAAKTGNTHSRGKADLLEFTTPDLVVVMNDMHRGNSGLSVTDPISPLDTSLIARSNYDLTVNVNGGVEGAIPTTSYRFWSGTFESAVSGVNASDADFVPGNPNTYCSRSGTTVSCLTPVGMSGSLTISGYYKNAGTSLWICADGDIPAAPSNPTPGGAVKSSTMGWDLTGDITGVVLSIESEVCPDPAP